MRGFTVIAFFTIVAITFAQYNTGYSNTGGYGTTGYTGINQYDTTISYGNDNQQQYDSNSASNAGITAVFATVVGIYAILN